MTRIRITASAMTRRRWMNPPNVYELTMPRSQRIRSTVKTVINMWVLRC
jgi:hypothetical protein